MAKPFFTMKLVTNEKLLNNLRQLNVRAQRNIRRKIVTELVPYLERLANELMSEPMNPVSTPFVFGTERSRLYYLAMIRREPSLADAEHWIRTQLLETGFQFMASDRFRSIQITGRNAFPQARYVFGPWVVQGHLNTGWPERAEQVRLELQLAGNRELARMWRDAVRSALEGKD